MVNSFFGGKRGLLQVILDTFLFGYHEIVMLEITVKGDPC